MATTAVDPTHSSSALARVAVLARDIKLSHSLFALPFALLGTFLAAAYPDHGRPGWATLALIVVCMVLARTLAMSVNRWADAGLDAANPRTARRAIPSGRLSRSIVLGSAVACGAALALATTGFWFLHRNPWPLMASPLVVAWLAGYSFTKRFTWLCHLFLGASLGLSPLAAALAVQPAFLSRPEPYWLAAMVTCWVAGFDVIYALQDVKIDREQGLFSMPSRLGAEPALWVSRGLHGAALLALVALWRASPDLGVGFGMGLIVVAGLVVLEHALGLGVEDAPHQCGVFYG